MGVRFKRSIFVATIKTMETAIRVRFAPSPTGPLHIGGVRTALFNYLFAKKHNGVFVLRIEDTDQNRRVDGAEGYIADALSWCGIPFDEGPGKDGGYGPYKQSKRRAIYEKHLKILLDKGLAYYAFDAHEDLDRERKNHEAKGKTFIYNWHNRSRGRLVNSLVLTKDEVQKRIDSGLPYVVRFLTPKDTVIHLSDVVRGEIEIDSNTLDDKILFKSDGMPTYHLANVVDDHLMEISHVIRGEEWLPSLALHQLLYTAFGWKAPKFAHLPLILKPSGKGKLSKRDGDKLGFPVFPIAWNSGESYTAGYRESGYFPDAVINFLAFLGWNPGTEKEFFKLNELAESFNLKQVNKAGARFDPEKILWFNRHYLQNKTNTVLAERMIAENEILKSVDPKYIALVVGLVKERANLSSDLWELCHYFFEAPKTYNEKGLKKAWKAESEGLMSALSAALDRFNDKSSETLKSEFSQWIEEQGFGFGKVMMPLRLALVGALEGADVFDIIHCIGKAEAIFRIKALIDKA